MRRLCILTLTTLLTTLVWAKPMPTPTLEGAVRESLVIVEVEYLGYETVGKVDYFSGPTAKYRVLRALKGQLEGEVRVRYDFTDGSACIPPKSWHFSKEKMPEPGSRWILFLTSTNSPASTYRGEFGRHPSNLEVEAKVEALL